MVLPVQVWLTIQRPGVFYGQCSELCGANHAFMPIVVEAVTPRQVRYTGGWCVCQQSIRLLPVRLPVKAV